MTQGPGGGSSNTHDNSTSRRETDSQQDIWWRRVNIMKGDNEWLLSAEWVLTVPSPPYTPLCLVGVQGSRPHLTLTWYFFPLKINRLVCLNFALLFIVFVVVWPLAEGVENLRAFWCRRKLWCIVRCVSSLSPEWMNGRNWRARLGVFYLWYRYYCLYGAGEWRETCKFCAML